MAGELADLDAIRARDENLMASTYTECRQDRRALLAEVDRLLAIRDQCREELDRGRAVQRELQAEVDRFRARSGIRPPECVYCGAPIGKPHRDRCPRLEPTT